LSRYVIIAYLVQFNLLGFYVGLKACSDQCEKLTGWQDPCIGESKRLRVRYIFRGAVHEVTVDDSALLRMPLKGEFEPGLWNVWLMVAAHSIEAERE
jgi:hypothetical protein